MIELSLEYLNKVANQTIFISALLGGFSLTVLVLLLENEKNSRLMVNIFRLATTATGAFLVAIFAMTKILMMTTKGYPFEVQASQLTLPKIVGALTFLAGIISVIAIVALSGWSKSKKMGRFTTAIGGITLLFVLMMLS